jgi:hypothetical protein
MSTSGSLAQGEKSADTCSVAVCVTTPSPLIPDAGQAGHPPPPVRAEQVPAAHHAVAAGGVVADRGPNAVAVLLEAGQLVAEPDPPRRELLRPGLQQRLQADLRQVQLPPRTRRPPAVICPACAPALQPGQATPLVRARAGEAGVERRRRHLPGRRAALCDRVRHAHIVQHLHRPLVQDMSLGQVRGLRPRADQQVPSRNAAPIDSSPTCPTRPGGPAPRAAPGPGGVGRRRHAPAAPGLPRADRLRRPAPRRW